MSSSISYRSPFLPYVINGCDVHEIVGHMFNDQSDHLRASLYPQGFLKYRKVVAEWILEVGNFFKLHATTTHAAISYLDRLSPDNRFSRVEWQYLAICCILVASKYNECEEAVPSLEYLEQITQQNIPNEVILNYELWVLKKLSWQLNARTPMAFLSSYVTMGGLNPSQRPLSSLNDKMEDIATKCLLDISYKSIRSSAIACAILYYVRHNSQIQPVWSDELTVMTRHNATEDLEVLQVIALLAPRTTKHFATANRVSSVPPLSPKSIIEKNFEHERMSSPPSSKGTFSDEENRSDADEEESNTSISIDTSVNLKQEQENEKLVTYISPAKTKENCKLGNIDGNSSPQMAVKSVSPISVATT